MKLTNISRTAGEEIETIRTSIDRACVTIPDGRTLLAAEHAALLTFAKANGITEEMLWDRIAIRHRGRVTEGHFYGCRATDLTALACCTKIETLLLSRNDITDLSALASCGELVTLALDRNQITDISALASCGRLKSLSLAGNDITDISAVAHCGRLMRLDLAENRLTDISALARCRKLREVSLPYNQITDISALELCVQLEVVEIFNNPLSEKAADVIEKLRARGVRIYC